MLLELSPSRFCCLTSFFVVDVYDIADDVNYRFVFLADLSLYSLIRPFISGMLISRWIVHSWEKKLVGYYLAVGLSKLYHCCYINYITKTVSKYLWFGMCSLIFLKLYLTFMNMPYEHSWKTLITLGLFLQFISWICQAHCRNSRNR